MTDKKAKLQQAGIITTKFFYQEKILFHMTKTRNQNNTM